MTAASLRAKLDRLADLPAVGMVAASELVERIANEEGSRIGPMTLGRKRRRVRLTSTTRIRRGRATAEVTVWGVPTGPWVWADSGTGAHAIPKRKPTARRPRPMHGAGYAHPISRKQIQHPGARGRRAWRRVYERAVREVPTVVGQAVKKEIARG